MVVAEIKKNVFVLVSQKRIPVNKISYEFPSGMIDKGENSISAACREFYEETGYKILGRPKKKDLRKLLKFIFCLKKK